jgi:anti-sigma factor RsiW
MTPNPHIELALGAYLLGALTPAEDTRIAAHLQTCPRCRTAYLELADTPTLLAGLTERDLQEEPPDS